MTLLQEIIEGCSGDSVAVGTLLRRVKVLAARSKAGELAEWVEHELSGYPPEAPVPSYRGPISPPVLGHLTDGFNQLKNAPIAAIGFPSEMRDGQLFKFLFTQSISELESLASADTETLTVKWPADAIALINTMIDRGEVSVQGGMYFMEAQQILTAAGIRSILDAVRNRVLDLALSMEALAPDAGEPGSPPVSAQPMQQFVANIYGGNSNVVLGGHDFTQELRVDTREQLMDTLRDQGIDDEDLVELAEAMTSDEVDGHGRSSGHIGPRVQGWIGRIALNGASKAGGAAVGAVAGLAAKAIAQHYGLGP